MRLTPRRHSRVVWEEGMFLAPHHFQAQRRHHEETTAATLESLVPYAYGVTSASLDTEALASGTLALAFVRGIMPDGTVVAAPDADAVPLPVPLASRWSPEREAQVVHVALAGWRPDAPNVLRSAADDGWDRGVEFAPPADADAMRYAETVSKVRDEVAGEESVEVRFATKRLRLALESELRAGDVSLPVARVQRDSMGRFTIDPSYIAPALKLSANEELIALLRRVVGMVEAKGIALTESMAAATATAGGSAPAAYVGNELATRWLLHAVRSAEGPLRHMLATRTAHPERLWLELTQLAGALCTFSLATQARDLPTYDHDDLGRCFGMLERVLRQQLDVVVAANAVVVPLNRASELLYAAEVTDPRCYQAGARWYLAMRSAAGPVQTAALGPQVLKACAKKFVLELVRRAYPGLTLEHVPAPPAALAPRAEMTYFAIAMAGPCEKGLEDSREFGVYVPETLPEAELELAILIPG